MNINKIIIRCFVSSIVIGLNTNLLANETNDSIDACLQAWGKHPFGEHPSYKTLSASVKIFGIGQNTEDSEYTSSPSLVLINPGVNVMGGSEISLLNPNGWYCFMSNVNVMGGVTIKAHCKAHIAFASEGMAVMGSNSGNKSTTIMGLTKIERIGCR